MYASHFNWLQVSFRRTSLSSPGFESRKGERFPRAQGRRYLPVSASILLYFESLILNPTLRCERACARASKDERPQTLGYWGRRPSRAAFGGHLRVTVKDKRLRPPSPAGITPRVLRLSTPLNATSKGDGLPGQPAMTVGGLAKHERRRTSNFPSRSGRRERNTSHPSAASSELASSPARMRSAIRPAFCRIAVSILAAMSGLDLRKALAFSRPWPIRW